MIGVFPPWGDRMDWIALDARIEDVGVANDAEETDGGGEASVTGNGTGDSALGDGK